MYIPFECPRCQQKLPSRRRWRTHMTRPCVDDGILARRARSRDLRASGVPIRTTRRPKWTLPG
jgi:hypothetical protein